MNPNNFYLLFPTRISRSSFLLRGCLLLLGGMVAGGMISLAGDASLPVKLFVGANGVCLLLVVLFALFRSALIPRLRDMGLHPAWSLLFFVHALSSLFLLALLLVPADTFAKRSSYGFR